MAKRRAFADEYAIRVNRAGVLLSERSPAGAVRALALASEPHTADVGEDHVDSGIHARIPRQWTSALPPAAGSAW
jgi:hypothetical protein